MPNYELTYILRPLEEANLNAAAERISNLVGANGGEIVYRSDWGRRRLAYPIRKHTDGYYTTLYITLPGAAVKSVERGLRLNEDVLRYLVVRVDAHTPPKQPAEPALAVQESAPAAAAPDAASPEPAAVEAVLPSESAEGS